jgi:hypothetical protein
MLERLGGETSMYWIKALAAAALVSLATAAQGQWHQARTDHFILTINAPADEARAFAAKLEMFDAALRKLYGKDDTADHRARPVEVYALQANVFLDVCQCQSAVGYYLPRAEGSLLFSGHDPRADRKAKIGGWSTQTILLHEYGHHFAFANFPMALPYWFSEGFAEFNATASFEPNGSIIIGNPANYRAESIRSSRDLTPWQFFEPERYGFGEGRDLVYARGWLLTHYLMLHPSRRGQLDTYLGLVNSGVRSTAAAERSFGDLKKLLKELNAYSRGTLAPPLRIPPGASAPRVAVAPLTQGQSEIFVSHAMVQSGAAKGRLAGLVKRMAKIAERHPGDVVVQVQAGEGALKADRLDLADEAANRALAVDPASTDALVLKGLVALAQATPKKDKPAANPAAIIDARRWFRKANRSNPDAVLPLYNYHRSFVRLNQPAPTDAVRGLMRAAVLAPESRAVRVAVVRQMLAERNLPMARQMLERLAYSAHEGKDNKAREVLEMLDASKLEEAAAALKDIAE